MPVRLVMHSFSYALVASLMIVIMLSITPGQALAKDIFGTWLVPQEKTHIRISNCGAGVCGTIVKLGAGSAGKDAKNPDPAKRNRSLKGIRLFTMSKKVGDNQWKGKLYNPRDGKTYTGKLSYDGKSTVNMKGCVLGGVICKGQKLKRIN